MTETVTGAAVPDHLRTPSLQRLYELWNGRRKDGRLPARADFDPVELGFVLGNVLLIDVLRDPMRFRIRVHGSKMVERAGYDLTGKLVDELPDSDFRQLARSSFTKVATTAEPLTAQRDRMLDSRRLRYETLMLPLSDDGAQVTMLLVALIYLDR